MARPSDWVLMEENAFQVGSSLFYFICGALAPSSFLGKTIEESGR